jgi:hypothetical protein
LRRKTAKYFLSALAYLSPLSSGGNCKIYFTVVDVSANEIDAIDEEAFAILVQISIDLIERSKFRKHADNTETSKKNKR